MITTNKMTFKINDNGNLTIKDDYKETVIHSDKFDLIKLMSTIKAYLDGDKVDDNGNVKSKATLLRYNPRSCRLEKVEE